MSPFNIKNIVIIGSGNVATHLATAFIEKGLTVIQVFSRTLNNARILGERINAPYTNILSEINKTADLYIIAISDSAVSEIVSVLDVCNNFIVHTSGSLEMDVLKKFPNHGVFYPLQTFSKNEPVYFNNIPILIEANNLNNTETLSQLADIITMKVLIIDSLKRKNIHLAAVFANNFTNYMYTIAQKIVTHSDVSFDLLKPLIKETALKINDEPPSVVQTGPGVRNDKAIIDMQLNLLNDFPDYKEIYSLLTKNIIKERNLN